MKHTKYLAILTTLIVIIFFSVAVISVTKETPS